MRLSRALAATAVLSMAIALPADPATAGGGCHQPNTEGTGTTVRLTNACMSPTVLRTEPGATVTFVNDDQMSHNVNGNPIYADLLTQGASARFHFADAGTFPYTCTLHPGMNGVVVVGDGMGTGEVVRVKTSLVAATSPIPPPEGSGGMPWPVALGGAAVIAIAAAVAGRRSKGLFVR